MNGAEIALAESKAGLDSLNSKITEQNREAFDNLSEDEQIQWLNKAKKSQESFDMRTLEQDADKSILSRSLLQLDRNPTALRLYGQINQTNSLLAVAEGG